MTVIMQTADVVVRFSQLVYPAVLAGFGLAGNAYILGGQIE